MLGTLGMGAWFDADEQVYQASDKGMLMAAYKFPITIYRG
jgi:hypothetical protein